MRKSNRKKNNKKYLYIIILILFILIILCSIYLFFSSNNNSNNNSINNNTIINIEKEEHFEASLIAVGDFLIHSPIYNEANRNASYNGYNFRPMLTYIKDIVSNYDIGYYNQETILGGSSLGLSNYPRFNSPFEAGDDMIDAGFNLVSLATNHTMDRGETAIKNSCNYWNNHEEVLTAGSYCTVDEKNDIRIKTINNISYTMLNYTYGTNGIPTINDYYVNVWPTNTSINNPSTDTEYQKYKEFVKSDIEKVRDKVDLLIVAMHWGVEYTHTPTEYEVDMATYLSSLGVDVIIGTHPHVIQPVTWINNTLVIYSLGNFLSAQYQNEDTCKNYKCTVGLMTSFKIEKNIKGNNSNINIKDVNNELIYTYYNQSTWKNFLVIPFSNSDIANYLPNYKNIYNTYSDIVKKMNSDIKVSELSN